MSETPEPTLPEWLLACIAGDEADLRELRPRRMAAVTAHIGSYVGDSTGLIWVTCDRHGDVLETRNAELAQQAVKVHDLCPPSARMAVVTRRTRPRT